nr:hypothetical protein [uncultured Dongia sp.]
MTRRHKMRPGYALMALLLLIGQAQAAKAASAEKLLGDWCDDSGYRIELSATAIRFRDRQMGDPPPGTGLVVKEGIATYNQDFRGSRWPDIGFLSCTLRLLGDNAAAESCTGTGYGYMPFFALKRCPEDVIS